MTPGGQVLAGALRTLVRMSVNTVSHAGPASLSLEARRQLVLALYHARRCALAMDGRGEADVKAMRRSIVRHLPEFGVAVGHRTAYLRGPEVVADTQYGLLRLASLAWDVALPMPWEDRVVLEVLVWCGLQAKATPGPLLAESARTADLAYDLWLRLRRQPPRPAWPSLLG